VSALPFDPAPGDGPRTRETRLVLGRREHALQSLLELSRELTVALGVHETADLLLFNLMGQLRTPRSAIWLFPEGESSPVLVRSHGFHRRLLDAIGPACSESVCARFRRRPEPVLVSGLEGELGATEQGLVHHASIAILAPLHAREELLGWLALGERVDGSAYGTEDLEVLGAALGIVAVSLQNARLYNRTQESNRLLKVANEHLSELDRLKTEFLSNVNHELRTPLAVVMASLECVVGFDGIDERARGLLVASLDQSKKLLGLIETLLSFSEVASKTISIQLTVADAGEAIRACWDERHPGVAAGLRELACRVAPPLPPARFDRARVQQVLRELVDNAVKFTPRGSHLSLSADAIELDGRTWVRLQVADDGPGIPPERIETLFRSFEQVDGSATRTVGGLGMGLAFAHRLARCMDARLTVTSEIGKGSAFQLLLPLAEAATS
jgi:signal transduction histidine kinase